MQVTCWKAAPSWAPPGLIVSRGPGASAGPPERVRAARCCGSGLTGGLSRGEASALFRKHCFAPQTAGGWAQSDWIEMRPDGRRYVTVSMRQWLAEQEDAGANG